MYKIIRIFWRLLCEINSHFNNISFLPEQILEIKKSFWGSSYQHSWNVSQLMCHGLDLFLFIFHFNATWQLWSIKISPWHHSMKSSWTLPSLWCFFLSLIIYCDIIQVPFYFLLKEYNSIDSICPEVHPKFTKISQIFLISLHHGKDRLPCHWPIQMKRWSYWGFFLIG
jgi:hypothetical protein